MNSTECQMHPPPPPPPPPSCFSSHPQQFRPWKKHRGQHRERPNSGALQETPHYNYNRPRNYERRRPRPSVLPGCQYFMKEMMDYPWANLEIDEKGERVPDESNDSVPDNPSQRS